MNDQLTETDAGVVAATDSSGKPFRALRIWPAVLLSALMLAARFAPTLLEGGLSRHWMVAVFGPLLCSLLILIWWLSASRATWKERLSGFLGIPAALALTLLLVDPTMRGPGTTYLTLPMGMLAFAVAAIFMARRRPMIRTAAALALAVAGFGFSILLRNEGMTGEYKMGTHWRWSPTAESLMLARMQSEKLARKTEIGGSGKIDDPLTPALSPKGERERAAGLTRPE